MTKQTSFCFHYKTVEYSASSIGRRELPNLNEVISVHALILMPDDKVLVVDVRSRGIDIVGGHVDEGETSAIQTLERELVEEANIKVKDIVLLDVLRITSKTISLDDRRYIIIFLAKIDELGEFTPNNEIRDRLILSKDEFAKRYFANAPNYIKHLFMIASQKE